MNAYMNLQKTASLEMFLTHITCKLVLLTIDAKTFICFVLSTIILWFRHMAHMLPETKICSFRNRNSLTEN